MDDILTLDRGFRRLPSVLPGIGLPLARALTVARFQEELPDSIQGRAYYDRSSPNSWAARRRTHPATEVLRQELRDAVMQDPAFQSLLDGTLSGLSARGDA